MRSMIPLPVVEFTPPAMPHDLSQRLHNQFAKQALRETLSEHWRRHTRLHFQKFAASRYGYARRSRKYRKHKQKTKGHDIDMLFSGDTRREMTSKEPKITTGGAASGGKKGLTGNYKLRFPFSKKLQVNYEKRLKRSRQKGYTIRPKHNVVPQLRREMEAWAGDEVTWARQYFLERYMEKLNRFRGRRQRKRKVRGK